MASLTENALTLEKLQQAMADLQVQSGSVEHMVISQREWDAVEAAYGEVTMFNYIEWLCGGKDDRMLVGTNHLELNEATVMKALEEYLNMRIVEDSDAVTVTSVKQLSNAYTAVFRVAVVQRETTTE